MKRKIVLVATCLLTLFITCCKKESIKGEKGDTGIAGANGNANVISSNTLFLTGFVYYPGIKTYQNDLTMSAISQDVIDKGAVMVYIGTNNIWTALPVADGGSTFNFSFYLGGLTINYFNDNGTTPTNPNGIYNARVLVIPSAMIKSNPNVDLANYIEVKNAFNIQE